MKRSDLSTRYVLFVVDYVGVNAWEHLSAAVPPKVALAAIQREVDAGNLDYGVWLGRPFLTPQGRAKLAELNRPSGNPVSTPDPTRPTCGEPADRTRFVRCDKPAGHIGDRHQATLPGGSYTWGYVPTVTEESA